MTFQPLLKDAPASMTGVLVSGVLPGTPAAQAGVQPGTASSRSRESR
jgi:S1-C subfamily serine protease